MLEDLRRWLEGAGKNPLMGIVWAVFVACFWFSVDRWESFDQRAADLKALAGQVKEGQRELTDARKMVETWHSSISAASDDLTKYDKAIGPAGYTPKQIDKSTQGFIEVMQRSRINLARAAGTMNNTYYEIEPLKELRDKLVGDLNFADDVTARRIEFLRLQMVDMKKARQMVPDIVSNIPEMRRVVDAEQRQKYALEIDEQARTEVNARVRDYNAKSKVFHRSIWLETASASYLAMVTVMAVGRVLRARAARKK